LLQREKKVMKKGFIDLAVLKEWESLTDKKKEVGEPTYPDSIGSRG
jgi:hypothetical protein